ncbi:MAG: hypothetical protein ACP5I8_09545 [Phycisphaerae bacterium]
MAQPPYPFFEDAAINSPLLTQLNAGATVFSNDVSYAAVYGTQTSLYGKFPLFADIQPLAPNGSSYFPWPQILDGAGNDSVVPTWSAKLPDLGYDLPVYTDHVDLESNPAVEAQVVAWLNNPNLPLGSIQRNAITVSNSTSYPQGIYAPPVCAMANFQCHLKATIILRFGCGAPCAGSGT